MRLTKHDLTKTKMVLAILLLFCFFYGSERDKLEHLKAKRDSLQSVWRMAEAAKARLTERQREINTLETKWAQSKKMLPQENEIQTVIQQIKNVGSKTGVKFLLFQAGAKIMKTNFAEIPIQIKATCDYNKLVAFLAAVGKLPQIVNISSMKIQQTDTKNVEAEISAELYIVKN